MTTATLLTYRSEKLGDVPYSLDDIVRFPDGVPGFEHLQEFLVVTREDCAPFVFLAALADPQVALPLLPLAYAAGAEGGVPVDVGAALQDQARSSGTLACYTVVSIGPDAREVIVNLRAPVVIDLDARRGSQVIVPDETVPLSATLKG